MQALNYIFILIFSELNAVVSGTPFLSRKCDFISDGDKYLSRDILSNVLEKQFCPDAVKQQSFYDDITSVMWIYNADTPEEAAIMID